jgi:hypothetical protein
MKNLIIVFLGSFLLLQFFSCSSSRDISERRSLMMPKVSEVPRNKTKYKEVVYIKRNNNQGNKSKSNRSSYKR